MIRIACFLVLLTATALATPPARVLVADTDPELVRAIEKALAPWKITVVVVAPLTEDRARARGEAIDAQFIVWRTGAQLVVFDRAEGTSERRAARAGAFDPVSAAAAALTVKTLLRLPPLAEVSPEPEPPGVPASRASGARPTGSSAAMESTRDGSGAGGRELRMQIGLGARVARGSQSELGGRAMLAVLVRPAPRLGLRLGIAGDLGTSSSISRAGFEGTWSDRGVLAIASWSFTTGQLEVAPTIGVGLTRSHLDGAIGSMVREETTTLPLLRAGVAVRWPHGRWSVGVALDFHAIAGAPTYSRRGGDDDDDDDNGMPPVLFEVPGFAAVVSVFAAAEIGR